MVEKDAHLGRGQRTPRGVLQDGANLLERYAGEPLHELCDESSVLKILEQGCHRHARTAEQPSSADTVRVALNRWARGPVHHGEMVPPRPGY